MLRNEHLLPSVHIPLWVSVFTHGCNRRSVLKVCDFLGSESKMFCSKRNLTQCCSGGPDVPSFKISRGCRMWNHGNCRCFGLLFLLLGLTVRPPLLQSMKMRTTVSFDARSFLLEDAMRRMPILLVMCTRNSVFSQVTSPRRVRVIAFGFGSRWSRVVDRLLFFGSWLNAHVSPVEENLPSATH